jgi:DNA (cytosine-5)-methyltransferase 1
LYYTKITNKMKFDEIVTTIKNKCDIKDEILPELPAIVSSALHLRSIKPPLISQKLWQEIKIIIQSIDYEKEPVPYPLNKHNAFTFIDLFAGIGGFRQAFQNVGGRCVFSSEWDEKAKKTYNDNYGIIPYGNIRNIPAREIPNHDVLCGGFPCQPFSIAGVSKKESMHRPHGFDDPTQGTLFFEIKRILAEKRPKMFMLENVKNILSHNNGKTIQVIKDSFEELGYLYSITVVDASAWVPQQRKRVFFVGWDPKQIALSEFSIPIVPNNQKYEVPQLRDIIDLTCQDKQLSLGTWKALQNHKQKHKTRNNGFGYCLLPYPIPEGQKAWTISARYYKDGADCLVNLGKNVTPRKLLLTEIMQLMGYDPKCFIMKEGIGCSYRQLGNSVVIPAIQETATKIQAIITSNKREKIGE